LGRIGGRRAERVRFIDRLRVPPVIFRVQVNAGGLDRRVTQVLLDEAQVGAGVGLM